MSRSTAGVALASVIVSVAAVAMTSPDPSALNQRAPEPETVPITSQTLGCPESPQGRGQQGTVLAVAPAQDQPRTDADQLSLGDLEEGAAKPLDSTDAVGQRIQHRVDGALPSVTVTGVGGPAGGLAAAQYVTSESRERGGLEGVLCEQPGDEWWFAGVDTSPEATTEVVLVNPTPAVAVVSLEVFGPDGQVATPGAQGIPVGPQTSQVIDLAGYVPGLETATLHVRATRGQVAPAVHVQRFSTGAALGSDWVPATAAPATDQFVSPTVSGPGGRTLVITNPSGRAALVQGRVVDEEGAFNPPELTDVRVPPGSTLTVDLDDVVEKSSAAVLLSANVPVVTGTLTQTSARGSDLTFAAAGAMLTGPAAVPVPGGSDLAVSLATRRPGGSRAAVAWYDAAGTEQGRRTLRLDGATTTVWDLPDRGGDRTAYVVVSPLDEGEPAIRGVVEVSDDEGVTTMPLVVRPLTVTRPAIAPQGP